MEKDSKNVYYDEEYIQKIIEQTKNPDLGLQDYKLCYVSNASDIPFVKKQIDVVVNRRKGNEKVEDITQAKILRHEGKSYLFYFIKKDALVKQIEGENLVKNIPQYNPLIEYNIVTGGYKTNAQKTNKFNKENLDMANHIVFINCDDQIQKMNLIPVVEGELIGSEESKKTFMECFITARQKNFSNVNLLRKMDGNHFYIYMEMKPEIFEILRSTRREVMPYYNLIDEQINSIRLDLDQIKNACTRYELLNADGSVLGQVTKENQAYINKNNTSSYCLIGCENFDSGFLQSDYEKTFNFGNAYPIDNMMFLPSKAQLKEIVKLCQVDFDDSKAVEDYGELERERFVSLQKYDPRLAIYNVDDIASIYNGLVGKERQNLRNWQSGDYGTDIFYSNSQMRAKFYSEKYELRCKMDYRDRKQNNKLIEMKNAWDLGYNNEELIRMKESFGDFGVKLYNRYYYIQFLKYLLSTYKITGTLLDLTSLSKLFIDSDKELEIIQRTYRATTQDKEFAKYLSENSSITDFIAIIQRFDGIINVKVTHSRDNVKTLVSKGFEPEIERFIKDKIGHLITNWAMCDNEKTFDKKGYAGNDVNLFAYTERKKLLTKVLNRANTVKKSVTNSNNPNGVDIDV